MKKFLATMLAFVMALALCTTAWAEETETVSSLTELTGALANSSVTTIDLNNQKYEFKNIANESIVITGKSITFKNGTFDFSGTVLAAGKDSFFDIGSNSTVTFDNVTFTGDTYNSAYGVIHAHGGSTVNLKDCEFDLKNEKSDGGVLKGTEIDGSDATFNVTSCNFKLVNTVRAFANLTINMSGSTVDSKINKSVDANAIADNAFRNVYGTIENSTITVDGHEHGIKNDVEGKDLNITESSVTLTNSKVADLHLGSSNKLTTDKNTTLVYGTVAEPKDGTSAAKIVTLTLDFGNGTVTKIPGVTKATANLVDYTPTKDGYTFSHWVYADGTTVTGKVEVETDTTLTAKWTKNPTSSYSYYVSDTTTTDTGKTSPKTFDAGIAMYVGMAVMSVTGMAYVGKKKF